MSDVNSIKMYISGPPPSFGVVSEAHDFVVEIALKWHEMSVGGSRCTYDDAALSADEIVEA